MSHLVAEWAIFARWLSSAREWICFYHLSFLWGFFKPDFIFIQGSLQSLWLFINRRLWRFNSSPFFFSNSSCEWHQRPSLVELVTLCFNRLFLIPTLPPVKEGERLLSWLCNIRDRSSEWVEKSHLALRGGVRYVVSNWPRWWSPWNQKEPFANTFFFIIKYLPGRNMKILVSLIFTMCIRIAQGSTQIYEPKFINSWQNIKEIPKLRRLHFTACYI